MGIFESRPTWIWSILALAGLLSIIVIPGAHAQSCETNGLGGGCDLSGGWDPSAKLNEIGDKNAGQTQAVDAKWPERSREIRWDMPAYGFNNTTSSSGNARSQMAQTSNGNSVHSAETNIPSERSSGFKRLLASISDVSNFDVILDISNGTDEYIPGAIHVGYLDFMTDNNTLKSAPDLAELLGDAGISSSDSVLIYGECQPCGGGPSAATFAYYVLKYLGHDDVKVLDGGIRDFAASNRTLVSTPATRPNATYTVKIRPELLATYEQVKSGKVQLVDARTSQEFGSNNIPGSLNIPYDSVLSGGRIKDEAALKKLFSGLKKDRTVVVYTNTGVKASMVWFALELLGYDAKLYTWQDYVAHRAQEGNSMV